MPTSVVLLFILYLLEMLTMLMAIGYVTCLFLNKKVVFNKHLQGRRLKVAALLPLIWFIYLYTDVYTVYNAGRGVNWHLPESSVWLKVITQSLSLVGGLILAMFVMGCKFER